MKPKLCGNKWELAGALMFTTIVGLNTGFCIGRSDLGFLVVWTLCFNYVTWYFIAAWASSVARRMREQAAVQTLEQKLREELFHLEVEGTIPPKDFSKEHRLMWLWKDNQWVKEN